MSTKAEDRPEPKTVGEGWRLPVVLLTLAGPSLVVVGQAGYRPNSGPWRWLLYLLMLVGLLLFLLPGFFVAHTRLPSWITAPLRRLANYLSISSGQLTLILMPLLAVVMLGGLTVDTLASQRYIMAAPITALLVAIPLSVSTTLLIKGTPRARPLILVILFFAVTALALNDLRY